MKINKNIKVAVIGCGYVGLPLALSFGKKFKTFGFDLNLERIKNLKSKYDSNNEFSKQDIKKAKFISFTYNYKDLIGIDYFIITVPTPVNKNNSPSLKHLEESFKMIKKIIKKGSFIILESTVYPGVTRNLALKFIEKNNFKLNNDYYIGYSPERINPGDRVHTIEKITKVVSASDEYALKKIKSLYSSIISAKIFTTKTIEVAEAAKVIENTQRDVNIALINEIELILNKMNINIYEVLEAANTKWNFLNFKPGLVGGHCIGVDPYYLNYIAKKNNYSTKIIKPSREINDSIANILAKRFISNLNKNLNKKKYNILILGFAFKENISDFRNTKILNLVNYLQKNNCNCYIYDNNIEIKKAKKIHKLNFIIKPNKDYYDGIFIAVNHKSFKKNILPNLSIYGKSKFIIYDYKNSLNNNKIIFKIEK